MRLTVRLAPLALQRVAVKDEEALNSMWWASPLNWHDKLPMEVWMYEHIKEIKPPCPYLPSSRGYRINPTQRRTRLYLEMMEAYSLSHVMSLRKEAWAKPPGQEYYSIPIQFVYYVFLAMAEGFLALDRGWWGKHKPPKEELRENRGRKEGWVPIVHRDMKPGNVFLGAPAFDKGALRGGSIMRRVSIVWLLST